MDRSFEKDKAGKQETVKPEHKDRKHEGARENRPERPGQGEGDEKYAHEKRDEEQDKKMERDEEQPKVGAKEDEDLEDKDEGLDADQPKADESESSNEVKVEPTDDEAPSQGV